MSKINPISSRDARIYACFMPATTTYIFLFLDPRRISRINNARLLATPRGVAVLPGQFSLLRGVASLIPWYSLLRARAHGKLENEAMG